MYTLVALIFVFLVTGQAQLSETNIASGGACGIGTLFCPDGTSIGFCSCASSRKAACATSGPIRAQSTLCGSTRCRNYETPVLTSPADPDNGICCPEYQCRKVYKTAPNASACYVPTQGPDTDYGHTTITCADGTQYSGCGCNSVAPYLPPGACVNSTRVAASSASCPRISCANGEELVTVSPANPANGICCPTTRCQPVVQETTIVSGGNCGVGTVFCADGTSVGVCTCARNGACAGSQVTSAQSTSCPLYKCGNYETPVLTKRADPERGICCSEYQCKRVPKAAPNASACYVPINGVDTTYNQGTITCADGTQYTGCFCTSRAPFLPPGVCANSTVVSRQMVDCPDTFCQPGHERFTVSPANPANGICCPTGQCRPIELQETTIVGGGCGLGTVFCADGRSVSFCNCGQKMDNLCAGSQVISASSTACSPTKCENYETPVLIQPANRTEETCCPEYQCKLVYKTAPNASACYVPRNGVDTIYSRGEITCSDGTKYTGCLCNSRAPFLPPGACVKSTYVSLRAVGCPRSSCGPGQEVVAVTPADPLNGFCCPGTQCRPVQKAVGSESTEFNGNSSSSSLPGYAIALLVIGSLLLVTLLALVVILGRLLRS